MTEKRDRSKLLFWEMSKEERAEERAEFLNSFAIECGGQPEDYKYQWEQYLNQEGYASRDEEVMMKRDREYKR
jgi:hypothetical protein